MNDDELISQPQFGTRLRQLRQARGLKQADLAHEGLSASYISRIESGTRPVTRQVAQILADSLGVTVSSFRTCRQAALAVLLAEGQDRLAAGNSAAAAAAFEAALEQAENAPFGTLWLIRHSLAIATANLGRLDDWRGHQEGLVALATDADEPQLLVDAYTGLSNCLRLSGRIAECHTAALTAQQYASAGDVPLGSRVAALIALIAAESETGRLAEATGHIDELLAWVDHDLPGSLRAQALWAVATSYIAGGRGEEAMKLLNQAIQALRSGEDLITWARLRLAFVSLAHRAGTALTDEMRTQYRAAADVLRLTEIPAYQVQLDIIEARIAFENGQMERVKELCEAALAYDTLLSYRDRARTTMLWARAVAGAGRPDEAISMLRDLAQRLDEAGARDLSAEAWRLVAETALTERPAR